MSRTRLQTKWLWVRIPLLSHKEGFTINNARQKVLDESNRKANKISVDKGSEFYERSIEIMITN